MTRWLEALLLAAGLALAPGIGFANSLQPTSAITPPEPPIIEPPTPTVFPAITTSQPTLVGTAATSAAVDLPSGIEPGDAVELIGCLGAGGFSVATPSNWSVIPGMNGNVPNNTARASGFIRVADYGWPNGATQQTVSFGANSAESAWFAMRIENHDVSAGSIAGGTALGTTGASYDLPAASSSGTVDAKAIEFVCADGHNKKASGYASTGYTGLATLESSANATAATLEVATKNVTQIASEDPDAMTINASVDGRAQVHLLYAGSEGTGTPPPPSGTSADIVVSPGSDINAALDNGNGVTDYIVGLADGYHYLNGAGLVAGVAHTTLRCENPGACFIDGGNSTLSGLTWAGGPNAWTATTAAANPKVVVLNQKMVLSDWTARMHNHSGLGWYLRQSGSTTTLNTGGVNPNTGHTTVSKTANCVTVNADDVTVTGLTILGCQGTGIFLGANADRAIVTENLIAGYQHCIYGAPATGSADLIEHNTCSDWPLYEYSVWGSYTPVDDEETSWGELYNTPSTTYPNSIILKGENAGITLGASGSIIRRNLVYNSFDCLQVRYNVTGAQMSEWYENTCLYNRDDGGSEADFGFSGFQPANFRFHHNTIISGMTSIAASPCNGGAPLCIFDHNFIARLTCNWADCLQRGGIQKSRSNLPTVNDRFCQNTIVGDPRPSNGFNFVNPQLTGSSGNDSFNNIIMFPSGTISDFNAAFTKNANLLSAAPGFTASNPYDIHLTAGSAAIDTGYTGLPCFNATLGSAPDRGAIEYGFTEYNGYGWPHLDPTFNVGITWGNDETLLQNWGMPPKLAKEWAGFHGSFLLPGDLPANDDRFLEAWRAVA